MRRQPISHRREQRRDQQRPHQPLASLTALQPLLASRAQAARLLACSVATLQRMEKAGRLVPLKLNPKTPSAQTYYRYADLVRLADGGDANA